MRIKPAAGLKVRDHVTRQLLPAEGIDIAETDGRPVDPHWQFMLRHGDVELVKAAAEPAAPPLEAPVEHQS